MIRSTVTAAAALLLGLCLSTGAAHAAAAWTLESSPTSAGLLGLGCAGFDACGAIGAGGAVEFTANGSSWASAGALGSQQLNAISCAGATTCWIVGNAGTILFTNTTTVTAESSPLAVNLLGVSCPDSEHCFAVGADSGADPVILATSNAGASWTRQTAPAGKQLDAIACTSDTLCWAVGEGGEILHTSNGSSWSTQTDPNEANVLGIACPSASVCVAVGAKKPANGLILRTTNGGSSWSALGSTGGEQLNAVACPNTTHCWAVGAAGLILATTTGTSWAAQTSGTTQSLNATYFSNEGFGWAVGAGGVIDSYGCRAGGLTLVPPSGLSWPSDTLDGKNQTLSTTASLSVDDESGSGAGWNLDLTSTLFANTAGHTLPAAASTVTAVAAAPAVGSCEAPSNAIAYPLTVPAAATAPAAVKIFDAAEQTGAGPFTVTPSLTLAIPANAASGSYSSTWTFTVASGP
jgi:hypothetical protein